MYEYTDKVIKKLNRQYLRLFNGLKTLKFDELNVMRSVSEVYKKVLKLAKESYIDICLWYYQDITDSKLSKREATDIVEEILEAYDSVTLYVFNHEVERKKARLFEALLASTNRRKEVNKGLHLWVLQSTQFCDNITDSIVLKSYKDIGIKKVRWVTEKDEKVCSVCHKREGRIYDIDKVPPKTHYNCRCWLEPVSGDNNGRKNS